MCVHTYVRTYAVFLCAQYVCVRTCVCTYIIKHTYIVGGGGGCIAETSQRPLSTWQCTCFHEGHHLYSMYVRRFDLVVKERPKEGQMTICPCRIREIAWPTDFRSTHTYCTYVLTCVRTYVLRSHDRAKYSMSSSDHQQTPRDGLQQHTGVYYTTISSTSYVATYVRTYISEVAQQHVQVCMRYVVGQSCSVRTYVALTKHQNVPQQVSGMSLKS